MCEELTEELYEGKHLARSLAYHLISMGAARVEMPVFVEDEEYRITVEHVPVDPADGGLYHPLPPAAPLID